MIYGIQGNRKPESCKWLVLTEGLQKKMLITKQNPMIKKILREEVNFG